MELSGVEAIQARISEIQRRFGIEGPVPGAMPDFQRTLTAELKKNPAAAAVQPAAADAAQTEGLQAAGSEPVALSAASGETARFIREAAAKYGLDSRLVAAVAEAESSGNQNEVSETGAVGVMQLMPDTATALGVNPFDEKQNIEGGAHYLKQMLDSKPDPNKDKGTSKPKVLTKEEIEKQMKEREAREKKRVSKLARVYNEMKPQQAAEVMKDLDDDLSVAILQKMDESQAAKTLAAMDADQSARLTKLMYTGVPKKVISPLDRQGTQGGDNSQTNEGVPTPAEQTAQ